MSGTWAGMARGSARNLSTRGLSMWVGFLTTWWEGASQEGVSGEQALWEDQVEASWAFPALLSYSIGQGGHNLSRINRKGHRPHPLIGRVPKKSGAMFYNHHTDHVSMTAPKLRDNIQSHKWVRHGVVSHLMGAEWGVAPANPSRLSLQNLGSTPRQGPGGVSPANSASQTKISLLSSS